MPETSFCGAFAWVTLYEKRYASTVARAARALASASLPDGGRGVGVGVGGDRVGVAVASKILGVGVGVAGELLQAARVRLAAARRASAIRGGLNTDQAWLAARARAPSAPASMPSAGGTTRVRLPMSAKLSPRIRSTEGAM